MASSWSKCHASYPIPVLNQWTRNPHHPDAGPRLPPLERNGWQVLSMLKGADGLSQLTSYNQLRRYLTTVPLGQRAGFETTARTVMLRRLTGWISLAGQRRDPMSGSVLAELFAVHDTPVNFQQACALDAGYSTLVQRSHGHANGMVYRVAIHILNAARHDLNALALMPPELLELVRGLPQNVLSTKPDRQNKDGTPPSGGSSGTTCTAGSSEEPAHLPPTTLKPSNPVCHSPNTFRLSLTFQYVRIKAL